MSALTAIQRVLQADSGVTSIVGNRRHMIELPQNFTLPAVVLTMVDEIDGRHLLGSNKYPVARFLVDCVGRTWDEADELGEAIKAALIDYRGTVTGYQIDDIGGDDLDFFDKGQSGVHWRRRLGFAARYRNLDAA